MKTKMKMSQPRETAVVVYENGNMEVVTVIDGGRLLIFEIFPSSNNEIRQINMSVQFQDEIRDVSDIEAFRDKYFAFCENALRDFVFYSKHSWLLYKQSPTKEVFLRKFDFPDQKETNLTPKLPIVYDYWVFGAKNNSKSVH